VDCGSRNLAGDFAGGMASHAIGYEKEVYLQVSKMLIFIGCPDFSLVAF
jgi:murein endopeptidase